VSSKPFDATLKDLAEGYPADWLPRLGLAPDPVRLIDADLSTVTTQADKVIRVEAVIPYLLHLELQARYDAGLPRSVLKYNALLHDRHTLPVHSCVVLLRPEAQASTITGAWDYAAVAGGAMQFRYQVVRLWREPAEPFLAGGLGTLPLAPLCDLTEAELPGVVRRMQQRVHTEAGSPGAERKLWASTFILMGLRYSGEMASHLLRGVIAMEESTTYQMIIDEGRMRGRLETLRGTLIRLGARMLGAPDETTRAVVQAITDADRLDALTLRLADVKTWAELLAAP
jgi:hypothetical protein